LILAALKRTKEFFSFKILDFCMLDDHVYFLIKPEDGYDLPWIMQQFLSTAARMWNKRHGKNGHLWRQRFMSRIVKDGEDFEQVLEFFRRHIEEETGKKVGEYRYCGEWHRAHKVRGITSDVSALVVRWFPELVPLGPTNSPEPV
jgi:REP element-mobilizing transposase RayT